LFHVKHQNAMFHVKQELSNAGIGYSQFR
jgi:hypothetical protein